MLIAAGLVIVSKPFQWIKQRCICLLLNKISHGFIFRTTGLFYFLNSFELRLYSTLKVLVVKERIK